MNVYVLLLTTHIGAGIVSIPYFAWRWLNRETTGRTGIHRGLPHVIDTVLLGTAVALMVLVSQYPFTHHWLTAKLLLVIGYIVTGILAMRPAPGARNRIAFAAALAQATLVYVIAISHNPAVFSFLWQNWTG